MKVLHVTSWPGPPFDGGRINRYHVFKQLAPRHRFRFVIVEPTASAEGISAASLEGLEIPNEGVDLVTWPSISLGHRLRGLAASGDPPGVAFMEQAMGPTLRATVASAIREWRPEAIMVWSPNLAGILHRAAPGLPKVLFACDSLSLLNQSLAAGASNPLRRLYHREVARRYRRYERSIYPRYDDVVFVAERDAEHALPGGKARVICNGTDTAAFRAAAEQARTADPPRILFHGNLGYRANASAARFLVDVVGPDLERRLGAGRFAIRILGGAAREDLRAHFVGLPAWFSAPGYVDDLPAELAAGAVYASPLTMGGGVKNKVLEALACGLPVVGTAESFAALPGLRNGVHMIECSLEQMSQKIIGLIEDPSRRTALGRAGRDWVTQNLDWDAVARQYERLLEGAVEAHRVAVGAPAP
jgi:glycosyltransferase involved in cell wall biosynthesis